MASTNARSAPWMAVLFAVVLGIGSGCSSHSAFSENPPQPLEADFPLEIECERELVFLDTLIEARRGDRRVPEAALAEAVELRRTAADLFLDGEYRLALELIDEAVSLLKGSE